MKKLLFKSYAKVPCIVLRITVWRHGWVHDVTLLQRTRPTRWRRGKMWKWMLISVFTPV